MDNNENKSDMVIDVNGGTTLIRQPDGQSIRVEPGKGGGNERGIRVSFRRPDIDAIVTIFFAEPVARMFANALLAAMAVAAGIDPAEVDRLASVATRIAAMLPEPGESN